MKIAIATTDGITVNEHFGKARKFSVYNAAPESIELINEIDVEPYAPAQKGHAFDEKRFMAVGKVLKGCEKLFITKIGDEPAQALKALGIEPVIYSGAVRDIKV
ncbi:MAG: hypothetical protein ISR96_03695 [Nitrospira sp.]|nr:hypothetical protein [bacterium]MBL7048619.1 hypothetical protein [Nitrospira sp.]